MLIPALPIPHELSFELRLHWLKANMIFPISPGDVEARQMNNTYFIKLYLGALLKEMELVEVHEEIKTMPRDYLEALVYGPSMDELIKLKDKRVRAGITAGMVLIFINAMERNGYDEPSLNKAARIIEEIAQYKKNNNQLVNHSSDRADISKAWSLMKNSAHLWAALEWMYGPDDERLHALSLGDDEEKLKKHLQIACAFRQFGCEFRASHTKNKEPLLDPENCLRLPAEFENGSYPLEKTPISLWVLDVLKEYRAPKAI